MLKKQEITTNSLLSIVALNYRDKCEILGLTPEDKMILSLIQKATSIPLVDFDLTRIDLSPCSYSQKFLISTPKIISSFEVLRSRRSGISDDVPGDWDIQIDLVANQQRLFRRSFLLAVRSKCLIDERQAVSIFLAARGIRRSFRNFLKAELMSAHKTLD